MRFRRPGPSWPKTLAFTAIHLLIALSLGWLFTGSWVLAGAWALVEPLVNTVAHHRLDRWWAARGPAPRWQKSLAFGASHLLIAVAVGWALTGSFVLASALALVEPLVNTLAHHLFDRWWDAAEAPAVGAPAALTAGGR
ncbi:MAG: DUF2061 domain-containing protein [Burkholderiales bacterium]|nr:DUF2061 domain-containing protein [Burkholderiales bacterium]